MFSSLLQVALGGALGASARYLVGRFTIKAMGPWFPWGTLAVNVLGSLLMGVIVVVLARKGNMLAPFLMTGLLGGFTTFSAFSLDAYTLYERGDAGLALAYVAASILLGLGALTLGILATRALMT